MSGIEKAVQKYESLREPLSDNKFTVSNYQEISYGLQFTVRKSNWSGIVRIYQNKQGKVKIDFSQLDESEYAYVVRSFSEGRSTPSKETTLNLLNKIILPVIGSDESGKGDYFGPLVSACIYVDENIANQLLSLGVKDSKTLSDTRILEVSKKIRSICSERFVVVEISAERYNQIYIKLLNERKSLNDLLAWAHAKALEEILSRVQCSTAIVDQFADEKLLLEKLQEKGKGLKIVQVHRAESHIAVAAASILARERFINKLDKLGKQYQVRLPKGASKEVVAVARQLVASNGNGILEKITKFHFKTTKEVLGNPS